MQQGFFNRVSRWTAPVACLACVALQACSGPATPLGTTYPTRAQEENLRTTLASKGIKLASAQTRTDFAKPTETVRPSGPVVWLFSSSASQAYLQKTGVDASVITRVWDSFLRKYKIPVTRISSAEDLEQIGAGVLLLPSAVVLSDREKTAIANFRAKGGSVLASWLTGVRKESGEWLGYDFMEKTLSVGVAGTTEDAPDDNFMIVHGDNPITHHLPAGTRVWLERIKGLLPLRLNAPHHGAEIMDWARTFTPQVPTGVIAFDERQENTGKTSRIVVLGYPEQTWLSADPKLLEAIAHNALSWLFRQPEAYVAAWPFPRQAAFVMAVEAVEEVAEIEVDFAKKLEDVGGRATYYALGDSIAKSATVLRKIQARGHEIGYFGDKFESFKDQSADIQGKRLDAMRKSLNDAGVKVAERASFSAPLESYDKTTEQILVERGYDSYIAFMDASDARLPLFAQPYTDVRKATVILPRTQPGPEDSMAEGDPDEGLQKFLDELHLSLQMGGLAISRIPTQSILSPEQLTRVFDYLRTQRGKVWLSTSSKVAQWWRDRSRIAAKVESSDKGALLRVSIVGALSPKEPVAIWVNLPQARARLRLESPLLDNPLPQVGRIDDWRTAIVLQELEPGEYEWYLHFDEPAAPTKN